MDTVIQTVFQVVDCGGDVDYLLRDAFDVLAVNSASTIGCYEGEGNRIRCICYCGARFWRNQEYTEVGRSSLAVLEKYAEYMDVATSACWWIGSLDTITSL